MMNFDGLKEMIRTDVEQLTGCKAVVNTVYKNNTCLTGLSLVPDGNGCSPVVYLESFYKEYMAGRGYSDILDDVVRVFRENTMNVSAKDLSFDKKTVLENVVPCLVNTRYNREALVGRPHRKWHDLSVYYRYDCSKYISGATIVLNDSHLEALDITEEELYQQSLNRLVRNVSVTSMSEIISSMFGCDAPTEDEVPMYVVGYNEQKPHGASVMLYPEIFAGLADKLDSDLLILPSSIHEVIALPVSVNDDVSQFADMVREVNASEVAPEDRLSDSVYRYSKDKREISLATVSSALWVVK